MPYHVNPRGEPAVCQATTRACPYGDGDSHFTSEEEARAEFEAQWAAETVPAPRPGGRPTRAQAIELDQFFTRDEVALSCTEVLRDKLASLGYDGDRVTFVEPSAGGGSFVRALETTFPNRPIGRGDVAPQRESIHRMDFLNDDLQPLLQGEAKDRIVVGNPPFGHRSRMAIDFVNRALTISDTVVMVLPIQFQKHGVQAQIEPDARLVHDEVLANDSFTVNGTPYGVQCCLQIWTRRNTDEPDLRRRSRPPIAHEDFTTWYVSSKPESKRHIEEADWTYAVVSQGFEGNFEVIPRERAQELSPRRHYMLIKPHTEEADQRLRTMDYERLAGGNTTRVKGFGKGDLVEAYQALT